MSHLQSFYKLSIEPDPDHFSTIFRTVRHQPVVECDQCHNCYGYSVAYGAPLDLDLDSITLEYESIENSLEHFIASSRAIKKRLFTNQTEVEILPGAFFIPVVWRTRKRQRLHYYSSPLSFCFDHISSEMHNQIHERRLNGFLTFEILTEWVDERGERLSQDKEHFGFLHQNCLRRRKEDSRTCKKCEFIRLAASRLLNTRAVSPVESIEASDYWYVEGLGKICSERFRALCHEIGASNLTFARLSDADYATILACDEWYQFGAMCNPG